jgi:putative phage-type endonuclease
MKIIDLDQRSPEWRSWRFEGVTATDITVLMGSSPYKTILQLWEEKINLYEDTASNPAINYGNEQEPFARAWIEENQGIELKPLCVVNEASEIARCSLDGYDALHNVIYEIKCPYSVKKAVEARINDQVPLYWVHQLQWQLFITGCPKGFLAVWDKALQSCHLIAINADLELQKEMHEKAMQFWVNVKTVTRPELPGSDFLQIDDQELKSKFDRYMEIKQAQKVLAQEEEFLKKELTKDGSQYRCFSYEVKRRHNPLNYDYKKMIEDGIDISPYVKDRGYHFIISKEKNCSLI